MATFYFNGADDIANSVDPPEWPKLGNWWMNSGFTVPATALPTSSDSVVASVGLATDAPRTVVNFITNARFSGDLTVTGVATFSGYANNGGTITGDCIFNDNSYHHGAISGNCIFNDSSWISFWASFNGTITGNCTFNDNSYNGGTITGGDCTFNGNSSNGGTITGDCTFNDSSYNQGTVAYDATFNDSSYNQGTVAGTRTFQNRTPYPIPRGINGSSILGVI
jgi:hypothetical protein